MHQAYETNNEKVHIWSLKNKWIYGYPSMLFRWWGHFDEVRQSHLCTCATSKFSSMEWTSTYYSTPEAICSPPAKRGFLYRPLENKVTDALPLVLDVLPDFHLPTNSSRLSFILLNLLTLGMMISKFKSNELNCDTPQKLKMYILIRQKILKRCIAW